MILIKKVVKCIFWISVMVILEMVLGALGVLDCLDVNIFSGASINVMYFILAIVNFVLLFFVINRKITAYDIMIVKHKNLCNILLLFVGILSIYKCRSLVQCGFLCLEFGLIYFTLDCVVNKAYKYHYNIENVDSNFIEKPVVGRNCLTKMQLNAVEELKEAIDKCTTVDGYNIALTGAWGSGKTSIINTLVYDLENGGTGEHKYFVLKINVLTLNKTQNIVSYVREYFEYLFGKYEINLFCDKNNIAFLNSLTNMFTDVSVLGQLIKDANNTFVDIEIEREVFAGQVQKLLRISGRKNIVFFIDDVDRSDEEEKIIRLLVEFASINGIISIISIDGNENEVNNTENDNLKVYNDKGYNKLDKFIHRKIKVASDGFVEYDKNITAKILSTNKKMNNDEMLYISFHTDNGKKSLFDSLNDYPTLQNLKNSTEFGVKRNLLTFLFFENMSVQKKDFGKCFEEIVREYVHQSKELEQYIKKDFPFLNVNLPIKFDWHKEVLGINFHWLIQLQSTSATYFLTLLHMVEAVDKIDLEGKELQNSVVCFQDLYEYWECIIWHNKREEWENRKNNPAIRSSLIAVERIVLCDEAVAKINELIVKNEYIAVRRILVGKIEEVAKLFFVSQDLSQFFEMLRNLLNNFRTYKIMLREAEMLGYNFLDYLIAEWEKKSTVNDMIQKIAQENPLINQMNFEHVSIRAFINTVLMEKYVLKYGDRYKGDAIINRRMFVYCEEKPIIVISQKGDDIKNAFFLDINGDDITDISEFDLAKISQMNRKIWSELE